MKLTDPLPQHLRIDRVHQKALDHLRITTISDLLYHLPVRYENISDIRSIGGLIKGADAIVYGRVGGLKTRKTWKSRVAIAEGWIEDGSARIKVMWFNQPYIAKMITEGSYVKMVGKVAGTDGKLYISNPEIEKLETLPIDRHDSLFHGTEHTDDTLYPVYRETKGITSKWIYHTIQKCFSEGILDECVDPLPETMLTKYHLPTLRTALLWIHTPKKAEHAQSARKRFAFEEVFYIQVAHARDRAIVTQASSYRFNTDSAHIRQFTSRFPFAFTNAQNNALTTLFEDFNKPYPLSRLIEGDVGSGKTAVAATAAYAVATSRPPEGTVHTKNKRASDVDYGNLQVAYMAPTEILAKQHFESFIEYFAHLPISIGLITGSVCMKYPSKTSPDKPTKISKAQLRKWVANGEIPILIGTHALMYTSVTFKHLALVVIDEQHRFGTAQRKALAKKDNRMPHLLSMTATPIPRTLALTIYGDLDITLLDEMPKGRKPIITKIVTKATQQAMYAHLHTELESGRQLYVICPRIDEPEAETAQSMQMKSVVAEAKRLQEKVFPSYRIGILHSKMTPVEKERIMNEFSAHKLDILVATSVVEVGVNVPNATNIVIEGAERFGLSQLHQLRGRVIRSTHQAYCFVVSDSTAQKTKDRLTALTTAKNGFELAEYDLSFRGSGELYGGKQSGLSDLGMEAIKNIKLVEAARTEAQAIVAEDVTLGAYPRIKHNVERVSTEIHME